MEYEARRVAAICLTLALVGSIGAVWYTSEGSRGWTSLLDWDSGNGKIAEGGEKWLWAESQKLVTQTKASKAGTSGKKHQSALSKVIAAAKAAAEHDTKAIRAVDDAIRTSQQALGSNAVHVTLLTGSDDSSSASSPSAVQGVGVDSLTDEQYHSLVQSSKQDKLAFPALAAAIKAARKNREAMDNAQAIIRQSEAILGPNGAKELYSLPPLGAGVSSSRPAASAVSGAATSIVANSGRPAAAAAVSWQDRMRSAREEHSFISATKFAREMP